MNTTNQDMSVLSSLLVCPFGLSEMNRHGRLS